MADRSVWVHSAHCPGDGSRRPTAFASLSYEMCLVRHGCFRYRGRRGTFLADPTTILVGGPDDGDYEVNHPQPGGDHDTFIVLEASALAAVAGGDLATPIQVRSTPRLQLQHRRLAAVEARHPDSPLLEELTLDLVAAILGEGEPDRVASGGPPTSSRGRAAVQDARAALVADPDLSLLELAAAVGCGPHHLSRLFVRETGVGVAAHRLHLRITQALDGLVDQAPSLAELAASCGFSDHAHLTRTLVHWFNLTPSDLRTELAHRQAGTRVGLTGKGNYQKNGGAGWSDTRGDRP